MTIEREPHPRPSEGRGDPGHPNRPGLAALSRRYGIRPIPHKMFVRPDPPRRPADTSAAGATPTRAPGLLPLSATVLIVGVTAGFLELGALLTQYHGLHQVGLSTLYLSRHFAWMVPVAETAATGLLAFLLIAPSLVRSAWSARRGGGVDRSAWRTWEWTGSVLGALLLLGPLLSIQGLHPVAALVLAAGAGFRLRRLIVRPTPGWRRVALWAGGSALVFLPAYVLFQFHNPSRLEGRAWTAPATASASPAPNLLWIVMDTVRADRMSLYGYERPTTPEIDSWASRAITFDAARSTAPWTLPSHTSMFTGQWPFEHGARIDRPYLKPAPTLAEHLSSQGYATAGIVANTRMCNARYGLGRGFDTYYDLPCNREISVAAAARNASTCIAALNLARGLGLAVSEPFPQASRRTAPEITSGARQWLDDAGKDSPFFLFLNFMDAHGPYIPLPSASGAYWTGPPAPPRLAVPENGWRAVQARDSALPEDRLNRQRELDAVRGRLDDLYDECLHGLDAELGRFLRELRAAGMLQNTWVVVTADHGEHFGEHDLFGHGGSLYNELTHVPLLLIPPLGTESGPDPHPALRNLLVRVPVSQRDLATTLTGLLLPGAASPFPGRSLARHWSLDGPQTPDPVLSQLESQPIEGEDVQSDRVVTMDSIIADDHVLIRSNQKSPELYHLLDDPRQERNIVDSPSIDRLEQLLQKTIHPVQSQ